MSLLPYPAAFPQEALLMMLDKFRGKQVNSPDLINAAWNVVGYGLGQSVGGGTIIAGDVPESASEADIIAVVLRQNGVPVEGNDTVSFTFVPWVIIAKIALNLILKIVL